MTGRYQEYPEYKEASVEWSDYIPKNWVEMPLKLLVSTRKGGAFKSADFCETGCKVVKASDIKNLTIENSIVHLPENFKSDYPKAVLNTGNIILSTVGSAAHVKNSAVGQLGRVPRKLSGSLLNQNTVIFESNKEKVSEDYLFILLQMSAYRDHLDLHAHGTANQASLNISEMLSFYCVLPPFEEQQKITAFLNHETAKIDTLIAKQEKLIELLKEKRQAVISHAVTRGLNPDAPMKYSGVEWLGEVPEHWVVKRIKNFGLVIGGYAFKSTDFIDSGYPVVKISNVSHLEIDWSDKSYLPISFAEKNKEYIAPKGALIFAMTRPVIAGGIKVFMMEDESKPLINQRVGFINIADENVSSFILQSSLSSAFKSQFVNNMTITNQPNISGEGIGDIYIPVPPNNELLEINKELKTIEKLYEKLVRKGLEQISLMKERKIALISSVVTGKIDVRNWQVK